MAKAAKKAKDKPATKVASKPAKGKVPQTKKAAPEKPTKQVKANKTASAEKVAQEKPSVLSRLGKLATSVVESVTKGNAPEKSARASAPDKAIKKDKTARPEKLNKSETAVPDSKPTEEQAELSSKAKGAGPKAKPEVEAAVVAKPVEKAKGKKAKAEAAQSAQLDEASKALEQRWLTLQKQSQNKPAPDYDMTKTYEAKSPLQHKVLGWGYVLENRNDRLEVLFRTGIKILISNYKP